MASELKTSSGVKDDYKSYELAEACQFPLITTDKNILDLQKYLLAVPKAKYTIESVNSSGPITLLCVSGAGNVNVVPYLLFKFEEFAGTTLITISAWSKIRTRAAVVGVMTLGISMAAGLPGNLYKKKKQKKYYDELWTIMATIYGHNGRLIASSFREDEAESPIVVDSSMIDPKLAVFYFEEPIVIPTKVSKFQKVEVVRKSTNVAVSVINHSSEIIEGASVIGGEIIPFVGIGFGMIQYAIADNNAQKGTAIGRMVGASCGLPLASFIGARVGRAIGKKADEPTHFEKTEEIISSKKKEAMFEVGICPLSLSSSNSAIKQFPFVSLKKEEYNNKVNNNQPPPSIYPTYPSSFIYNNNDGLSSSIQIINNPTTSPIIPPDSYYNYPADFVDKNTQNTYQQYNTILDPNLPIDLQIHYPAP